MADGDLKEQETTDIPELEARIEYSFKDKVLAIQALTHSSARDQGRPCNGRPASWRRR